MKHYNLARMRSRFLPPQSKIIATTGSVTATTTGMESEVKSIMVRKFSLAVQHRLIIQNEAELIKPYQVLPGGSSSRLWLVVV